MVLIDHISLNKCRLCHSKLGQHDINFDKKFIKEIYECIKIKVNDRAMNLLPHSVCDDCKTTIKDFLIYRQHVRKVDKSLRSILSNTKSQNRDNQKEPSFTEEIFETHIKPHSNKELYSCLSEKKLCLTCNIHFSNLKEYESHPCQKKVKENIEEKDPVLALRAVNKTSDGKDFKTTSKKISEDLHCKICSQEFSTTQEFKLHKKSHKRKFICSWKDCDKILNSAYTLKTHELKHEGKRSFLCVTCGKGFITKNSLTCHEKIHLDVKGYICKLCNIGFSVRSNLRAHEKKHHEGIRFYCSQCTKAFVSKCSLERHERIHAGIKEFQCESCPSAFYTNKELVKHQRYHQGLRLHKCDECFKTFFERHHLVIHLRSHTGERPYVCKVPDCGKSFMESQKLKRHHNAKHAQT